MKILQKTYQHRRDFVADMVCECCGYIEKNVRGYDDTNFHENVIPRRPCPKCGKISGKVTSQPNQPDWVQM
jgi:Zn finger protein HypA/HybF involved in hydrogenase expression